MRKIVSGRVRLINCLGCGVQPVLDRHRWPVASQITTRFALCEDRSWRATDSGPTTSPATQNRGCGRKYRACNVLGRKPNWASSCHGHADTSPVAFFGHRKMAVRSSTKNLSEQAFWGPMSASAFEQRACRFPVPLAALGNGRNQLRACEKQPDAGTGQRSAPPAQATAAHAGRYLNTEGDSHDTRGMADCDHGGGVGGSSSLESGRKGKNRSQTTASNST